MEDKYFRIDSGTRLMSVMRIPSIGFPVGRYGYTSTGDMLESINRMIGELMDDSELSMFHNVDGERMFNMVCHNIGVPCGEDYRLLFPLNDIKGPVGYETVEVSIGRSLTYDDIEIDCDRRLYVLSNLDSRKGLIEFLECLKGLVLYGLLMNNDYQMRTKEYDKSDMICPDERYEFCFWDTLSPYPYCEYRYVSRYIMCEGAKHYVIDCGISIFKEKESIIKFCNALIGLFEDGEFRYDGIGKLELPDFNPTEPLKSDNTKYDRYPMDGEWRKKEKVKTGGRTVKFDVEEEKEKLRILDKKLEFYQDIAFSIIMFLTMLSGVFFLVFAVIKLLS